MEKIKLEELKLLDAYFRASNYLAVGQLYLLDNPLLRRKLTLEDIIKELSKPGRDPREDMPKPILRNDVLKLEDLKEGMVLNGTVRNVIDFGAFVDIGVHQDGLVHISQICDKFIKHPIDVLSVGDIVKVKIVDIDVKKGRIALSMR